MRKLKNGWIFGGDSMVKVLEVFKLRTGYSVLMCLARDVIGKTGNIITSIGTFDQTEYEIAEGTSCFTDNNACGIILKTSKDCSSIKEIRFA